MRTDLVRASVLAVLFGLGAGGDARGEAKPRVAPVLPASAEGAVPHAPSVELSPDEAVLLVKALKALPTHVDRTSFDVGAKAATLKTVEASFTFVRDEIANEVYPGALRGATGTLSAQAGNAADKALLLGALLKAQRRQVRYARCELEDDRAEARVRSVSDLRKPPFQTDLREALVAALGRLGMSRPRSQELADARAARDREQDRLVVTTAAFDLKLVQEALKRANVAPSPTVDATGLVEEARAHYWLQVKDGARWQSLDPSFRKAAAGQSFCETTETSATLPEDAYQTVAVGVRNEYLDGGEIRSVAETLHTFRAAELHGQALLFFNLMQPTGPTGRASARTDFAPVLLLGDRAFLGRVSSFIRGPAERQAPADTGDMLGGGGGEDEPSQGARLVAQWLELELSAPGRSSTVARAVVDEVAPAERARGAVTTPPNGDRLATAMAKPHAIAISTGRLDPVACLETAILGIDPEVLQRIWSSPASRDTSMESKRQYFGALRGLLAARALVMAREVDRSLIGPWRDEYPHSRAFRHAPLIVIADFATARTDTGAPSSLTVDLRSDQARVFTGEAQHAGEAFWLNAHRGMIDGALERPTVAYARVKLPAPGGGGARDTLSTSELFDLARAAKTGWKAAAGADAIRLLQGFGTAGGYRLAREVDERTAVVVPEKPLRVGGESRLAMWTIDLVSGQVIPLLDSGLRQGMSEYGGEQTQIRTYEGVRLRGLSKLLRQCIKTKGTLLVNQGACDHLIEALHELNQKVMAQLADTVIIAL